jgi:hypothetical protein
MLICSVKGKGIIEFDPKICLQGPYFIIHKLAKKYKGIKVPVLGKNSDRNACTYMYS